MVKHKSRANELFKVEPQRNNVNRPLTGIEAMLELRESDPIAEMRLNDEQKYRH